MTRIREANDEDALDLIELIGSVFGEYAGCVLDVEGELPELRRLASWAGERGGRFWVAEDEAAGRIVAMGGYTVNDVSSGPPDANVVGRGIELRKLYVHRRARTGGLGGKILDLVEGAARELDARYIEMWSDTRFVTAHGFYARRGYEKSHTTRDLHDKSASVEFYFVKKLG
ncbi:MAG: GNAT family N-acetyltransferase [Polyangiaceae bacterium]|nr:GNAT family N-acetyltransferase [Polyangiaceae bacterium]